MSKIFEAKESIHDGIHNFQCSAIASERASQQLGHADHFLKIVSGGILQIIEDIKSAQQIYGAVTTSYNTMASHANRGTESFRNAAGVVPPGGAAGSIVQRAEGMAQTSEALSGYANTMGTERLEALVIFLAAENSRLEEDMDAWTKKRVATEKFSNLLVPEAIIQPAEQWKNSF